MYPHRIRLAGPWQLSDSSGQRILQVPLSSSLPNRSEAKGGLELKRLFRWPTSLLPHERLWLILQTLPAPMRITLNGQSLGDWTDPIFPFSCDITPLVKGQNLLELRLAESALADRAENTHQLWHGGLLEVRRDIHLQNLVGEILWEKALTSDSAFFRLQVTAQVSQRSPRPLAIVVRVNHTEVHYQDLPELGQTTPTLQVITAPFTAPLWTPRINNQLLTVEIHLLDSSCLLDQRTVRIGFRRVTKTPEGNYLCNQHPAPKPKPWTITPFIDPLEIMQPLDAAGEWITAHIPQTVDQRQIAAAFWPHACIADYSFAKSSIASRKP